MSEDSKSSTPRVVSTTGWNRSLTVFSPLGRMGRGKLVIAGKNRDAARMLEVRLARAGCVVSIAETEASLFEQAGEEQFDVALIDCKVLNGDPVDAIPRLREDNPLVEVLLLSEDDELMMRAFDAGAFDVLSGETNSRIIAAKVSKALTKVVAERDRHDLGKLLHAQTKDMAMREVRAEQHGHIEEEPEDTGTDVDLDSIAGVDPLTGLPNRRMADERFRKEAARALRYDRPLCVCLASIDTLEPVLEAHGAELADGILRGVASIFSGMVRDVDFVARRQGGEFVFIFPETPKESGAVVVERMRQKLAQSSFTEQIDTGDMFQVTASFGVAGLPADTMNASILHDAAEAALDAAKKSGDKVVLFDQNAAE